MQTRQSHIGLLSPILVALFVHFLSPLAAGEDKHIWIQLENHPWDMSPRGVDRMMGDLTNVHPRKMQFVSPSGPISYDVHGFNPVVNDPNGADNDPDPTLRPVLVDALILRRYQTPKSGNPPNASTPPPPDAWTIPDDRKVNPWDLNERDPRERDASGAKVKGTMGTIPGPTIECNVGDKVIIHFRNRDHRSPGSLTPMNQKVTPADLVHSLHTHGFVFKAESDGAYPLSPLDENQPIDTFTMTGGTTEAAIWSTVPGGLAQFKDASAKLFKRGDRVPPDGTFVYAWDTVGWPTTAGVWLYHDHSISDVINVQSGAIGIVVIHPPIDAMAAGFDPEHFRVELTDLPPDPHGTPGVGSFIGSPIPTPVEPTPDTPPPTEPHGQGQNVITPPTKAQYLLLLHTLGTKTSINGRLFLGNTPTLIAGTATQMRFGVVGMGNAGDGFHTFHLHGHRWTIPGPDGTTSAAIQSSAQVRAVSQFEDTRAFGPANSFVFTVDGRGTIGTGLPSFMRAGGPNPSDAKGEWHMHCHVLDHMMNGMMGSLKIVEAGDPLDLPKGVAHGSMIEMRRHSIERMNRMNLQMDSR